MLENGYTRIANELIDALVRSPFTLRQLRVVLEIARLTYGYRKRTAPISTKKVATACGLQQNHTRAAIAELLTVQVLFREGGQKGEIGINNHIDQWRFAPDLGANPAPDLGANPAPDLGANPAPDLGANPPPTHYKKKENLKEKEKESETPSSPSVNSSINSLPMQVVEAWNRERPSFAITPILPPKRQTRIQDTLTFVVQCFGYEDWPTDEADVNPWFAELFAMIERGDLGAYLQARDFDFFMDPDRLHRTINEGYRHD